jgi:hypothetical protein
MKAKSIIAAVEAVTAKYAKQRKLEERHARAVHNRQQALRRTRVASIKDVAYEVMEKAYLKASAGGTLPALARQIMYAARPFVQERTIRNLDDKYFTQTLLPDYIEAHPEKCARWDVVYDARGRLYEPHTKREVPLGTLDVRRYLSDSDPRRKVGNPSYDVRAGGYPTHGPKNRYGDILFIEKEGFLPLFEAVNLAQRYDLAIMSTKGTSVTASRKLVDELCSRHCIRVFVLHDFDKAGFSILGTLGRDTRRYKFANPIEVIDLGMRLGDIGGLPAEAANYQGTRQAAELNLRENGATDEEIEFLLDRRVELNAFASDELVAWVEKKLIAHGVEKLIPDDATLASAYQRASEYTAVQKAIDKTVRELRKTMTTAEVPVDLREKVTEGLAANSKLPWDWIVTDIAEANATAKPE